MEDTVCWQFRGKQLESLLTLTVSLTPYDQQNQIRKTNQIMGKVEISSATMDK